MDRWVEERQLQVHFVSAAGLVYRDGKILLIRSTRRGWEIPGGVVEQGETVLDCLKREIYEESGILAEPKRLAGINQRLNTKPGYGPLEGMTIPPTVNLIFICSYAGGTERISDESLETGWFTPDEAKTMVTSAPLRKILEEALASDGDMFFSAFVRSEDGTRVPAGIQHIGDHIHRNPDPEGQAGK